MAELKSTTISGDLTVTGKIITNDVFLTSTDESVSEAGSCTGQVLIGGTWYTLRTGSSGAANYITFAI